MICCRAGAPAPAPAPAPSAAAGPTAPALELPQRFIAVIVDGFAESEIDGILDSVGRSIDGAAMRPVVLTRLPELGPYRRRGVPVELLVDPCRQPVHDRRLPWHLRRRVQLRGFVRLWQPAEAVSFARPPDQALLAELRAEIATAARLAATSAAPLAAAADRRPGPAG